MIAIHNNGIGPAGGRGTSGIFVNSQTNAEIWMPSIQGNTFYDYGYIGIQFKNSNTTIDGAGAFGRIINNEFIQENWIEYQSDGTTVQSPTYAITIQKTDGIDISGNKMFARRAGSSMNQRVFLRAEGATGGVLANNIIDGMVPGTGIASGQDAIQFVETTNNTGVGDWIIRNNKFKNYSRAIAASTATGAPFKLLSNIYERIPNANTLRPYDFVSEVNTIYDTHDDFYDIVAAGSVNNTTAKPGPGARTIADANSVLSIIGDGANFATGGAGNGNPALFYTSKTRVAGKVLLARLSGGGGTQLTTIGWNTALTGNPAAAAIQFQPSTLFLYAYDGGSGIVVGSYVAGTIYDVAVVLGKTGSDVYIKGGAFTYWTLLWSGSSNSTATLYPEAAGAVNASFVLKSIRTLVKTWKAAPLVSDSFSGASLLLTNGQGHPEGLSGGDGGGGAGAFWVAQVGTWAVSGGTANASAVVSSLALATVPTPTKDVVAKVKITRASGQGGLLLRFTDINNYIFAYHDGTNASLKQVVAGVTTNIVATTAATYAAGAELVVTLDGTAARLSYNSVSIGTGTINAALISQLHGLYTTDITITFDDFVVRARGTGNEYAKLDEGWI